MVKPILQQTYRRSEATDIRLTFELERQRLTASEHDQVGAQFGARLGRALVIVTANLTVARAARERQQ